MQGLFSVKSDVYSFGVLLLEIISGKKNNTFRHSALNLNLLAYVSKQIIAMFTDLHKIQLITEDLDCDRLGSYGMRRMCWSLWIHR